MKVLDRFKRKPVYVTDQPADIRQIFREELAAFRTDIDAKVDEFIQAQTALRKQISQMLSESLAEADRRMTTALAEVDERINGLSEQVAALRAEVDTLLKDATRR